MIKSHSSGTTPSTTAITNVMILQQQQQLVHKQYQLKRITTTTATSTMFANIRVHFLSSFPSVGNLIKVIKRKNFSWITSIKITDKQSTSRGPNPARKRPLSGPRSSFITQSHYILHKINTFIMTILPGRSKKSTKFCYPWFRLHYCTVVINIGVIIHPQGI